MTEGITLSISFSSFSFSHWIFCFKYWVSAQRLKLLLNGESPKKRDPEFLCFNALISILNIVIPAMYAWSYTNMVDEQK